MYRAQVNSRINDAKEFIREITKATGDTNKQRQLIAELSALKSELSESLSNKSGMKKGLDTEKIKELQLLIKYIDVVIKNQPERQKRPPLSEEPKLTSNRVEAQAKAEAEAQAQAVKVKNIRLDALAKYLATLPKNEIMKNQQYTALSNANKQALEAKIGEEKKTATQLSKKQTNLQSQKFSSVNLVSNNRIKEFAKQEGQLARELALSRAEANGKSLTPEQLNKVEANAIQAYLNPSTSFNTKPSTRVINTNPSVGAYTTRQLSGSPKSTINVKKEEINEITNVNELNKLRNKYPELREYIGNRIAKVQGAPPVRRDSKTLLMEGKSILHRSIIEGKYDFESLLILRENSKYPEFQRDIENAILKAAPKPEDDMYVGMVHPVVAEIRKKRAIEAITIAKKQAARLKEKVKIKSNLKALEIMNKGGYDNFIKSVELQSGEYLVKKILNTPSIKAKLKQLIANIDEVNV